MSRPLPWRWWVCLALLLATLLNYMDRQALTLVATDLKQRYYLDDGRYGQTERYFSWAFGAGSIAFGWLADRFGPRRLYPLVLVGWSLAGIATPWAGSEWAQRTFEGPDDGPGTGAFLWLRACRAVLGFFEAGHWPCALIAARQILSAAERPFGNGLLQSGASLGAIVTPPYVLLVQNLGGGWEAVFWSVGTAGLLWVPLWLGLVRRGDLDGPPPAADAEAGPTGRAFAVRFLVLLAVVASISVSWQFLRAWLPKYLREGRHYSPEVTAAVVAGYYVAADLGCIASGYAAARLAARGRGVHSARLAAFVACCGLTALAAAVPYVDGGPWALAPLLMLVGAGILGLHPLYYAFAQELPARRMGLLSGCLAAATWFAVGNVQGAVGAHIQATGSYAVGFLLAGTSPLAGLAALALFWRPGSRRF